MDIFGYVRSLLNPPPAAPLQFNQPDIDPIDPATGKLLPGGTAVPPLPQPAVIPNGGTAGPLNAQEALQRGDPKLTEFMKQRQGIGATQKPASPAVPAAPGYGAKPKQNSFGDGTSF